ncbi:zinc finger BED domain-containing protein 4-like [Temnothorax nylanderi]|uniref:zinc finger BED domain-containing protein 4-like n=1 Tax=Temnothorax nylanderi TaxID=102681 RepID=UPI003A865FB2
MTPILACTGPESSASTGIRCAAHTLQLAVDDALKRTKTASQLISKARNLAKKLRTQTFIYLIKKQNFKKPTIDCPTRWCSTIDMLENLLLLKDYCEELSVTKFQNFVTLKDAEWSKIEEICTALRPSKICTKKLQTEQLTLSEFFGVWFETKVATEAVHTPFATLILEQSIHREQKLINNNTLLSAVFMDPRYKVLLDKTQIERAKTHLKHLWAKIISLNRNDNLMNESNENFNGSSSNSSETGSTYDDKFENFLKLKERQHNFTSSYLSSKESDLYLLHRVETELERYNIEQKRLNRKINVLPFWEEKKQNQPELYKLAMTVLSVPATQVSVERLFSGLKFILSPLRTNINEHILENQLLIRANRIFCSKEETKLHIKEKRFLKLNDLNEYVVSKISRIEKKDSNGTTSIEKKNFVAQKEKEKISSLEDEENDIL